MIRKGEQLGEPYRFTVKDYYRMGEAGILKEDDRVELLNGEVVRMTPIGPDHADIVDRLTEFFASRVLGKAVLRVQNPVRLNEHSEPAPDVVLASKKPGGYRGAHPTPRDVLLLIEVSDTTLERDRRLKLPLYAMSGVQEVLMIDAAHGSIDVYELPSGETYRRQATHRGDDRLAPRAFDDCSMRVGDLFE